MKRETSNFWIFLIVFLLVVGVFIVIVLSANHSSNEKENVCKKVGVKTGLDYYSWTYNVGWGVDAHYVCKFLDEKGDIVLKYIK